MADTKKKTEELVQEPLAAVEPPVVATDDDDDDDLVLPEIGEKVAPGEQEKYYEAVGRRKESVARVRLFTRKASDEATGDRGLITVNGKDYADYFLDKFLVAAVEAPLKRLKSLGRFKVTVKVSGGGIAGQADAVAHGISRALELFDANFRKKLKKAGFLKRDPRAKERRKYGLKKARKAPQWRKR